MGGMVWCSLGTEMTDGSCIDPVSFTNLMWPDVHLYDKQREIMYSVQENDETYVPAGNALGKDFVSALIAIWFMVSRRPARVLTTSVKYDQLNDVLWGEIRKFLQSAKYNLPIRYTHQHIHGIDDDSSDFPLWELVGQVCNKSEGLLGRHLPRGPNNQPTTLAIFDEASGIDDDVFTSTETWAHRKLIIGNPFPCENFFKRGSEGGDMPRDNGKGFYRKVIRIRAIDSPNVKYAQAQIACGLEADDTILVPGVKSWSDYNRHRKLWDPILQCVGLDAEWYKGGELFMFPEEWLSRSFQLAVDLKKRKVQRHARVISCDPAEGGDDTVWTVIDEFGLIDLIAIKTPDTSVIISKTMALMAQYHVPAEQVIFDAGGGGKEHADRMRKNGYQVRTVGFGEGATDVNRHRVRTKKEVVNQEEIRYVYKNRRVEMYGTLRNLLNPLVNPTGFAIPQKFAELIRQLKPVPLMYDEEGRMELPPKARVYDPTSKSAKVTINDLIGCSPDHSDSLVMAVWALTHKATKIRAGAL